MGAYADWKRWQAIAAPTSVSFTVYARAGLQESFRLRFLRTLVKLATRLAMRGMCRHQQQVYKDKEGGIKTVNELLEKIRTLSGRSVPSSITAREGMGAAEMLTRVELTSERLTYHD